jgi:serine/threonine-protein kinase
MWEQERAEPVDVYRAKSKKAWTVVLSIVMVLALAIGGFFFYNWIQAEAARNALVDVPELATLTQSQAESKLTGMELVPKSEDVFDDTVKSGLVIASNPSAKAQVVKGSAVTLMVSKGPENLKIPVSISGSTEATARALLFELGLKVGTVSTRNDPKIPAGSLIDTVPKLGEQVKSGSTIDLILSTGVVTVPQLVELTVPEATSLLSDPKLGLRINVVEEENSLATPGTVIDQDPQSGATSQQGGTVTVIVAKAPVVSTPTEPVVPPATSESPNSSTSGSPTPSDQSPGADSGDD